MVMNKINEFVKEKGIKPSECTFHTIREVKDEKESPVGKLRVLVAKIEPSVAHVELYCPKCKKESYQKTKWNDFKNDAGRKTAFVIVCPHCSHKHEVRRMNDEAKREMKKSGKGE